MEDAGREVVRYGEFYLPAHVGPQFLVRGKLLTLPQVTEGRHIPLTEGPLVSVEDSHEAVSKVDEHPGGDHHAVDTRHPLHQHQRHSHTLREERGDHDVTEGTRLPGR